MVSLSKRFLLLAALVATAALNTTALPTEPRDYYAVTRNHAEKGIVHVSASGKGHRAGNSAPVVPLPPSSSREAKKGKEHGESDKRSYYVAQDGTTWDPLDPIVQVGSVVVGDGRNGEYSNTHALLDGAVRRDAQEPFNMKRSEVVYGVSAAAAGDTWDPLDPLIQVGSASLGDGRNGEFSNTHGLLDGVLKRSPHHHGHHRHDDVVVNGSNDRVHVNDRREPRRHHGHKVVVNGNNENVHINHRREPHWHHAHDETIIHGSNDRVHYDKREPHRHHGGHRDETVINGSNDNVHVNHRREPHSDGHGHHRHDKVVINGSNDRVHVNDKRHHHDHHRHNDKTIINGSNDNVHLNDRREPHNHGHHRHDGDVVINGSNDRVHMNDKRHRHGHSWHHDKTVINGDNDNVHYNRRNYYSEDGIGLDVGLFTGSNCWDSYGNYVTCPTERKNQQRKRRDEMGGLSGVPGTVDIMDIGGALDQHLASLVMSSVPANATNNTATDTKDASSSPSAPFVLDASNSTKTQFYLVANEAQNSVSNPAFSASEDLADSQSFDSSKAVLSSDIQVSLQVPVFDPSKAAMTAYCATFDPSPPTPAPLTMEPCFANSDADKENVSGVDSAAQKSQIFAYNPVSGVIRPLWLSSSPASNSTTTTSSGSDSTSTAESVPQMNFALHDSVKDGSVSAPAPPANATQTLNGTLPSLPSPPAPVAPQTLNGTLPSPPSPPVQAGPQNVTMVFTPAEPAIEAVSGSSTSFAPGDGSDASDTTSSDSPSSSSSSSSATDSATATDIMSSTSTDMPPATDSEASTSSTGTTSGTTETGLPTDSSASSMMTDSESMATSTADEAEIERMYQYPEPTESA